MFNTQPVIFVTGTPVWLAEASSTLQSSGYEVRHFPILTRTNRAEYLDALTDSWAALVLVDGDRDDWQPWVVTVKAAQATRRIPMLVVAADAEVRRQAYLAGAGDVLVPGEIGTRLAACVDRMARHIEPADAEIMACQCAEPLPPLAQEAVRLFNAGDYYRQHDLFEEQWMEETGPVRELYRAVLQVGVAYYHITQGNHLGALKMLRRSVQWFALLPDICQGIDVRQLRADAGRVREALEMMDPADIDSFDRSLFRPVIWHGTE